MLLEETIRTKHLERTSRLLESFQLYGDFGWESDLFDSLRQQTDQSDPGAWMPPTLVSDRRSGHNWPLWRTEIELGRLRQRSRIVCQTNSYAEGLLNGLVYFTVGDGGSYQVSSKEKLPDADPNKPGHQDPDWLDKEISRAQDVLDEFCKRNRWCGEQDHQANCLITESRELETCRRMFRDGEGVLRLFHLDNGRTAVRFVDPEQIQQPPGASERDGWSYGIRHQTKPFEDVETILEYHLAYKDMTVPNLLGEDDGSPVGELVPANEIILIKAPGTDSTVKRGTSIFHYDTLEALERAAKLQRNASVGAAIRAATAEIWQHAFGTQSQISALSAGLREASRTDPVTGRSENVERIRPGAIRRIPEGQSLVQPVADNTSSYLTGVQGDLRQAASAFNAPEYLASGDASNGNYSSIREAGTPFVRGRTATQGLLKSGYLRVMWRVLLHAAEHGLVDRRALSQIDIQCELTQVVMRDELQRAQEDQILISAGIKSQKTAAMERGLDWDTEEANRAEFEEHHGQGGGGGLPGMDDLGPDGDEPDGGDSDADGEPEDDGLDGELDQLMAGLGGEDADDGGEEVTESRLLEVKDPEGYEHGNDGKFTGSGGGGSKSADAPKSFGGGGSTADHVLQLHKQTQKLAPTDWQQRSKLNKELTAAYSSVDAPEVKFRSGGRTDTLKPLDGQGEHWLNKDGTVYSAKDVQNAHGVNPVGHDAESLQAAVTQHQQVHDAKLHTLDAPSEASEDELKAHWKKNGKNIISAIENGSPPTKVGNLDLHLLPSGHAVESRSGQYRMIHKDKVAALHAKVAARDKGKAKPVGESLDLRETNDDLLDLHLLEAGFTGQITDKAGRKRHYVDGKQVKMNSSTMMPEPRKAKDDHAARLAQAKAAHKDAKKSHADAGKEVAAHEKAVGKHNKAKLKAGEAHAKAHELLRRAQEKVDAAEEKYQTAAKGKRGAGKGVTTARDKARATLKKAQEVVAAAAEKLQQAKAAHQDASAKHAEAKQKHAEHGERLSKASEEVLAAQDAQTKAKEEKKAAKSKPKEKPKTEKKSETKDAEPESESLEPAAQHPTATTTTTNRGLSIPKGQEPYSRSKKRLVVRRPDGGLKSMSNDELRQELKARADHGEPILGHEAEAELKRRRDFAAMWYGHRGANTREQAKKIVETSLAAGETVPPEVLADYPDLADKYRQAQIEKGSEAAPAPKTKAEKKPAAAKKPAAKAAATSKPEVKPEPEPEKQPEPESAPAQPAADPKQSARDAVSELLHEKYSHTRMIPVGDARELVRQKYGDRAAGEAFDTAMKQLWRDGDHSLVGVDPATATDEEKRGSIPGVGETLAYIVPDKHHRDHRSSPLSRDEQATLKTAVDAAVADLAGQKHKDAFGYEQQGMIPIHKVRDAIRAKLGDKFARHDAMNEVIKDLWRDGKARLVSISDLQSATRDQLNASVPGVSETLFYVVPKAAAAPEPKVEPAKSAPRDIAKQRPSA